MTWCKSYKNLVDLLHPHRNQWLNEVSTSQKPQRVFLMCSHRKWGSSTPTACGVGCHLWFSEEKHLLCLPMTLQLSQPTSQPLQHRPKRGTAEDKGLLHGPQQLTPRPEEENSVGEGSHSHIGQGPARGGPLASSGQHTAKFCFLEVRPPCLEQCPGWVRTEGCKEHHAAKLPLHNTNQPRALQCQRCHAKTKTWS